MRRSMIALAVAAAAGNAAPAAAQIWIGQVVGDMIGREKAYQQEHACMMGTPMPAKEIDETRAQTAAAIGAYAAAVMKSRPADVRAAWHDGDRKARWNAGTAELKYGGLSAVTDPFITAGARIDTVSRAYLRSGDGKWVHGEWAARDQAGNIVGIYNAVFIRELNVWKLRSLALSTPSAAPESLVQFCHKPGDVEPYKIAWDERQRRIEAKRAAKAAAKAARESGQH